MEMHPRVRPVHRRVTGTTAHVPTVERHEENSLSGFLMPFRTKSPRLNLQSSGCFLQIVTTTVVASRPGISSALIHTSYHSWGQKKRRCQNERGILKSSLDNNKQTYFKSFIDIFRVCTCKKNVTKRPARGFELTCALVYNI